jgi:hypothetical protein
MVRREWVVDARKPFGGPEHVLQYLARYTHRVASSNHRLISMQDGKVTFRGKDYAHGGKKRKMTLTAEEFIRRFLLHVLRRAWCVFATTAGWRTAAGAHARLCVAPCWALSRRHPPLPATRPSVVVRIADRDRRSDLPARTLAPAA